MLFLRRHPQPSWPSPLASSQPARLLPPPPHPRPLRRRARSPRTAGWFAYPSLPAARTPARTDGRGSPRNLLRRPPSRCPLPSRPPSLPSPSLPRRIRPRSPMPRHLIRPQSQPPRRPSRLSLPLTLPRPPPVTGLPPARPAARIGTARSPGPPRLPSWLLQLPQVARDPTARRCCPSSPERCCWQCPPEPSRGGPGTATGSGSTELILRQHLLAAALSGCNASCLPRGPAGWLSEV